MPITFKTKLHKINDWTILQLPESASEQLPSRGQVMLKGTINDFDFLLPADPDGKWGHWMHITEALEKDAKLKAGDTVNLSVEPTKEWPEPTIPEDIREALDKDDEARAVFESATPMARWEWMRWIRATNSRETRTKRIEVARSKLRAGERRPCCWNRNMCTEPEVSKSGVLLEPTDA